MENTQSATEQMPASITGRCREMHLWLSFRQRLEDQCTGGIFLMFPVKGISHFWRNLPPKISFVRKKLTIKNQKVEFWKIIPFDFLISPKIFWFIALKIRLSFVKKNPKKNLKSFFFGNLKTWYSAHSKNLGRYVFFGPKCFF